MASEVGPTSARFTVASLSTERSVETDLASVLGALRVHAGEMLADLTPCPRSVRVQAGEVSLHIEWDTVAVPTATVDEGNISHHGSPALSMADTAPPSRQHHICAPTVGVFYRSPEPGSEPFVSEGDSVVAGQQLAILEAMKVMIPIEADSQGTIAEVVKGNGEMVEYGESLFVLTKTESA